METPRRATPKQRVGSVRAVPTKRALRNDARKLGVIDAITEIVDNSIDNYAKQDKLHRPPSRLRIEIEMNKDEIVITENSGGVTPEDLQAFVQVGSRGENVDAPRIGVWGAGQKLAVAALGNDVAISSRYWNSSQRYEIGDQLTDEVILKMDEKWWADDDDWDVPAYIPDDELPIGVTVYDIRKLNRRVDEFIVDEVIRQLRDFYGDILSEGHTTITVNETEVEGKPRLSDDALALEFAWPPGLGPTRHWFELEKPSPTIEGGQWKEVDRKLRLEIIVGLTARQDVPNAGVWFFGVPETESGARLGARYFAGPLQEESVGYSSGPRSMLRKGHPTIGRLRMYVICYGDSEIIPWGLPGSAVKRGYNASNIFADEIREAIREVAKPYIRFAQKAREIDFVPYAAEWNTMSAEERKALVRRGAYLQAPEDVDEQGVASKVSSLLRHEFKPNEFLEWDHATDAAPPESVPAFNEAMSKDVVSLITERDKRLKEIGGYDPGEAVDTLVGTLHEIRTKNDGGWQPDTPVVAVAERAVPVTVRLQRTLISRLTQATGKANRSEAIVAALEAYLETQDGD